MQFAYPTQNRYNDVYQQRLTNYGTAYRQKYLSRASNDILKMFGDNVVINGLVVTPTWLGSVITLTLTSGVLIHDSTAVEITAPTLTCDVVGKADTTSGGAYLGIFSGFQYIESPDVDSQTSMSLSVYHVSAAGVPTAFSGSPAFSTTKNKVLISKLKFTLSGAAVTACSEVPSVLAAEQPPSLLVSGVTYYMRGQNTTNINSYTYLRTLYHMFLNEFTFHDMNS